jgi:uncharacterized protein
MRAVFVDTAYWVAQSHTRDQWHQQALEVEQRLTQVRLITSELVLVEFLNYFCNFGAEMRERVAVTVQDILEESNVEIVWQTQALFESGLDLYKARLDKGYSLTDSVSMVVMRQERVEEVLTHDRHFAQEGFTILL